MFDYETLKLVWWVLIGVLLIGFALTDGFDMGAMALMPFVGKTDNERRVAINTIAPHWDGNQVWFITGGGALFAAWPMVYAVAFSGLYWAMLLVLFALFCRPVGFDYRSKVEDPRWRNAWDWALFVGGAVPALVFGVAFGNLFLGLPFQLDELMRSTYHGSFFALLNPFALLTLRARLPDVPLIVDAGIGTPSHAAQAMELGFDAVLLNTVFSGALPAKRMAEAFRRALGILRDRAAEG